MSDHGYAATHQEFGALAERLLVAIAGRGSGYTPPENAHMLVDTALALAEGLASRLRARRTKNLLKNCIGGCAWCGDASEDGCLRCDVAWCSSCDHAHACPYEDEGLVDHMGGCPVCYKDPESGEEGLCSVGSDIFSRSALADQINSASEWAGDDGGEA